jgi:hypothetical protein
MSVTKLICTRDVVQTIERWRTKTKRQKEIKVIKLKFRTGTRPLGAFLGKASSVPLSMDRPFQPECSFFPRPPLTVCDEIVVEQPHCEGTG